MPPEDVALVNQQPISAQRLSASAVDFVRRGDLEHATYEQRRKVLNDRIREELFVQRGKELDVASIDPDVRSAMVNSVELEIAADAITAQPNEAQLRAYYSAHRTRYASEGIMTLHDYVFPAGDLNVVADAAEALKAGPPTPASLAQWQASESGKVSGEEFYFAAKIHLGEALFETARNLPDGGASAPIVRPDGIHVLYMSKNKKPVAFEILLPRAIKSSPIISNDADRAFAHRRRGVSAQTRQCPDRRRRALMRRLGTWALAAAVLCEVPAAGAHTRSEVALPYGRSKALMLIS